MKQGAFTFVLHSHIPYCRQAGRWPHGEEWLHEAAADTYLPLLNALYDLKEEGVAFRLTLGMTPVLVEQLADPLVLAHLGEFLDDKVRRAAEDVARFEKEGDLHRRYLAQRHLAFYGRLRISLEERFGGSIVGALRRLQDEGYIEILTSAATHGYLPLLSRDSSIHAQFAAGVQSYKRHFGRAPRAAWLPECGYRPSFYAQEEGKAYVKPGLEGFLARLGISLFFSETHTVEGGEPVGKARGDAIGPYAEVPKRYVVPLSGVAEPTMRTTYLPYWVGGAEVAVMGRNNRTGLQVWSADNGYPGDFDYREFHKKDGVSGLHYWRVTGARVGLGEKDYYHPEWAEGHREIHADHFARLVENLVTEFHSQNQRYGIIAACYDTELFGHWWFEGIDWIAGVLRRLAQSPVVDLVRASDYLEAHPPEDVLALAEGSWGLGGGHFTWDNVDTGWMWPLIHEAERRMEGLAARYPEASGPLAELLTQAGRELLLAQSSDWPFLITSGQAREYATSRFQQHLERFHRLAERAETSPDNPSNLALARELYELDKVFPDLDYHLFALREGLP